MSSQGIGNHACTHPPLLFKTISNFFSFTVLLVHVWQSFRYLVRYINCCFPMHHFPPVCLVNLKLSKPLFLIMYPININCPLLILTISVLFVAIFLKNSSLHIFNTFCWNLHFWFCIVLSAYLMSLQKLITCSSR